MKNVLLGIMAAALMGSVAFAGPFVGVEFVPTGFYKGPAAFSNFVVGWDSGTWIKTAISFSDPFIPDGSYGFAVSPLWNMTPSWRIGGAATFGFQMDRFELVDACWALGFETVGKWRGIMAWVRLTFPMKIYSAKPLGGALITVGFGFDFLPCCIGEVPGCPEDLLGGGCK